MLSHIKVAHVAEQHALRKISVAKLKVNEELHFIRNLFQNSVAHKTELHLVYIVLVDPAYKRLLLLQLVDNRLFWP